MEVPKVCIESEPPEIPTLIRTPCEWEICYNKENALKLWIYIRELQNWVITVNERCKGIE